MWGQVVGNPYRTGNVAKEPTNEPGNLVAGCGRSPSLGKYHATSTQSECSFSYSRTDMVQVAQHKGKYSSSEFKMVSILCLAMSRLHSMRSRRCTTHDTVLEMGG